MPDLLAEYGFTKLIEKGGQEPSAEIDLAKVEEEKEKETVVLTDAAIMEVIHHYCGHEAGVRNLKKCLDRIFRKIVAKLETQEIEAPVENT